MDYLLPEVFRWIFAGFCEEVGWRGVLFPLLKKETSVRIACLYTGVIWFIWHIPMILAGDILAHFPMILGTVLFLIETICLSFIMGRLSELKYGNTIWIFVSLHAVHNIIGVIFAKVCSEDQLRLILDGGYVINVVLILFVVLLYGKWIKKKSN